MGFCKSPIDLAPLHQTRKRSRCNGDNIDKDEELVSAAPLKRVRFARPSTLDTGAAAEENQPSELYHVDLDKKSLWWSRGERALITSASRKLAKSFRKSNADRVDHYLFVFGKCSQTPSHSTSDYLETATLRVPAEVRGLEYGFVPSIKACRRTHSQEVVTTQQQLLSLPQNMRWRLLSTRAMRSSRASRVMARLIGDGDAEA